MRNKRGRFIKGHGFTESMKYKMCRPRLSTRKRIIVLCGVCNKSMEIWPSYINRNAGKYCSNECRAIGRQRRIYKNCISCQKKYWVWESRENMNESKYCSQKCRGDYMRGKGGAESRNWQGGIDRRRPFKIKQWRERVFNRDDYTCRECGKGGCPIEAHHYLPYSIFPEFRYSLDNGATLCKDCHANIRGKEMDYLFKFLWKNL